MPKKKGNGDRRRNSADGVEALPVEVARDDSFRRVLGWLASNGPGIMFVSAVLVAGAVLLYRMYSEATAIRSEIQGLRLDLARIQADNEKAVAAQREELSVLRTRLDQHRDWHNSKIPGDENSEQVVSPTSSSNAAPRASSAPPAASSQYEDVEQNPMFGTSQDSLVRVVKQCLQGVDHPPRRLTATATISEQGKVTGLEMEPNVPGVDESCKARVFRIPFPPTKEEYRVAIPFAIPGGTPEPGAVPDEAWDPRVTRTKKR